MLNAMEFGKLTTQIPVSEEDVERLARAVQACVIPPSPEVVTAATPWPDLDLAKKIGIVVHLMNANRKIDAIKEVRSMTGLPLKDAKDLVEGTYRP